MININEKNKKEAKPKELPMAKAGAIEQQNKWHRTGLQLKV